MRQEWNPYRYEARTAAVTAAMKPKHAAILSDYFRERHLSPASRINVTIALKSFTDALNTSPKRATKEHVLEWIQRLRDAGRNESTVTTYVSRLIPLFRWMGNAKAFDWWKPPRKSHTARKRRARDALVDPEHIRSVIDAANHPQTRALVAVLYDTGARVSEILSLRIKDVDLTEYGARLRVIGKTGERTLAVVKSAPYLKLWLEHHAEADNPDAYVFYANWRGRHHMTPGGVLAMLQRLCAKAGVPRFHPHQLRHTRLTELAKKMPEQLLKAYAGWTNGSTMAAVYVSLSGKDTERGLLEAEGVAQKKAHKPEPSPIEPVTCPICDTMNPAGARYCYKCSQILDPKLKHKVDAMQRDAGKLITRILENPRAKDYLARALALIAKEQSSFSTTN
ncbi:MAG: tyrosine-type recombinase/integrase [Candidatus Ranarchaeia archaeon]